MVSTKTFSELTTSSLIMRYLAFFGPPEADIVVAL
jgi:hypothetical protein